MLICLFDIAKSVKDAIHSLKLLDYGTQWKGNASVNACFFMGYMSCQLKYFVDQQYLMAHMAQSMKLILYIDYPLDNFI